jgi:cytidyltransferase-like protein
METRLGGGYRRKIKSVDELCSVLGPRPRQRSTVMCHGVFDLVHPGHIRHLVYAKEKADILIASLTADAHITKANYRPFVPEDLRALNLAALEMVDYVIIDPNPTPRATNTRTAALIRRLNKRSMHCRATAARSCLRQATSSTHRRT